MGLDVGSTADMACHFTGLRLSRRRRRRGRGEFMKAETTREMANPATLNLQTQLISHGLCCRIAPPVERHAVPFPSRHFHLV
jgi:hypothetical protein